MTFPSFGIHLLVATVWSLSGTRAVVSEYHCDRAQTELRHTRQVTLKSINHVSTCQAVEPRDASCEPVGHNGNRILFTWTFIIGYSAGLNSSQFGWRHCLDCPSYIDHLGSSGWFTTSSMRNHTLKSWFATSLAKYNSITDVEMGHGTEPTGISPLSLFSCWLQILNFLPCYCRCHMQSPWPHACDFLLIL